MGEKRGMKALELWCKRVTDGYQGVRIENMSTSWRDGLAFCAIIHHFRPDLIDFASLKKSDILHNNELAFRTAEVHLGIPALLDAEDMVEFSVPDRLSILTYLSQFYQAFASGRQSTSPMHNRTPPGSKRPASPSVLSPSSQTPTKVVALGPARREPCAKCGNPVFIAERLLVGRRLFHRACFRCARCTHQLSLANYYETEDGAFCCEACPDEVDGNAAQESRDECSRDFEDVSENIAPPAKREIVVTEAKQDVAMSNFMIGQLQWEEKEVSLPLPPSIVRDQETDNQGQLSTVDTEISSRETSAPVSLASDSGAKAGSVDNSNEQSLYFCTKTNSSTAENDSLGGEEVPVGVSRSSVSNFSDSVNHQPSTATNKTEDCINDQNELTTKRTKDLDDEPNSIVKMRMKMFDGDQQKENTPRKKYSSRTSITLSSKCEEGNKASENVSLDCVKASTMEEEKITEGVGLQLSENDSSNVEASELVAQKDQDLNFVTGSVSNVGVGMSEVENVNNLDDIEMRQESIPLDTESAEGISCAAITSDPVLPSIVIETPSESQEDDALTESHVDTVLDTENLPSVDITESVCLESATENDLPVEKTLPEQDAEERKRSEDTSKRGSMKDDPIVYPTELNPFGDDSEEESSVPSGNPFGDEDETQEPMPPKGKPPRPPPPRILAKPEEEGAASSKPAEEEVSKASMNPFWSDGEEPESEDEANAAVSLPVPLPRSILKVGVSEPSPAPRLSLGTGGRFGSSNSLSSADSSANSTLRRRKKTAPPPPPPNDACATPPEDAGAATTLPRHRKARPAPPPPGQATPPRRVISAAECDKSEKELANRSRQSKGDSDAGEQSAFALAANKSMYGQWKRKKGPAPPRPVPQRRQIREIPMKEVKRELQDIEVRQLELERQGVRLEKTIRGKFDDEEPVLDVEDSTGSITPDVEDMVMLLFEIVNEKNELFRRQAELMYLRRQHRLEEEHADLEYEIRVSLERPEHMKTDSEKAYEEELIRRLVDIVERRDEIVNCLEMDRQREAEEDRSIHQQLATFAAKYKGGEDPNIDLNAETDLRVEKINSPKKSSTLKILKKKVLKTKKKEVSGADADKDVDELDNGREKRHSKEKTEKSPKKKWF